MPLREAYFAGKEDLPQYIIGPFYYVLTIGIELPIVYFFIKKESTNKKRLVNTIIIVNLITTLITFIIERLICKGTW